MTPTCPECDAESDDFMFNAVDITTEEDKELGQVRYALRCEACGFATAFIAKENDNVSRTGTIS
jgi:hypothetical protein